MSLPEARLVARGGCARHGPAPGMGRSQQVCGRQARAAGRQITGRSGPVRVSAGFTRFGSRGLRHVQRLDREHLG
jgi:hypothetical protein